MTVAKSTILRRIKPMKENKLLRGLCVLTAALMLGLTGCASSSDANGSDAQSQADTAEVQSAWTELDQTTITKEMGMGWNLGNQLEASNAGIPSETTWGNPTISEDLIKAVKEQGFKTVRIPVSYLDKIGAAPDYTIDSAWLDRVQEVVDYVVGNDLYAIINIHGDGYYTVDKSWLRCVDDNQDEIKDKYEKVWAQIADRFKDYDQHLIFESMNEESDNTYGKPNATGYENINAYNQIFVDTVRKTGSNNEKRWLLIPGWNGDKGFGVINRSTREITQPDLIAAMMRAINSDGDYEIAAPKGFEK